MLLTLVNNVIRLEVRACKDKMRVYARLLTQGNKHAPAILLCVNIAATAFVILTKTRKAASKIAIECAVIVHAKQARVLRKIQIIARKTANQHAVMALARLVNIFPMKIHKPVHRIVQVIIINAPETRFANLIEMYLILVMKEDSLIALKIAARLHVILMIRMVVQAIVLQANVSHAFQESV